jgi:2-keto-4-pentenoate hydratase/2-oxohepta-3-ene-1,7-dioic acid hydratase in catechol pathway
MHLVTRADGDERLGMKFVTFRNGRTDHVGMMTPREEALFDLTAAGIAPTMIDLVGSVDLRDRIDRVAATAPTIPLKSVKLLAPIPVPPRNIFCVGKNYSDHAKEFGGSGFDSGSIGGSEAPEFPIVFTKPPSTVIGPGDAIRSDLDPLASVDYEAELAVVIKRPGRVTDSDDPMSFVFGYTIFNDVTSRELQKRHKQWLLGKGIDTFGPMGPAILSADAVQDVRSLQIMLTVNGERRQSASIADLIFDIPSLIRTIGRSISFQPGDIIATGTPAGVGIGFKPPRYLRPGDRLRIEVPAIGVLENSVC